VADINSKNGTRPDQYLSEFQIESESGIHLPGIEKNGRDHNFSYSDGARNEEYILQALKKASDVGDNSEELMAAARDWSSYYHLGAGRSNIIRSLNLPKTIRVLELGAGCGAITRYLGENFKSVDAVEGSFLRARAAHERCRDLKNVKIFCSDFKSIKFNSGYDAVVMVGVLEYAPVFFNGGTEAAYSTLLELAKTALNPGGVLIIAIENKIGLKYWSGCPKIIRVRSMTAYRDIREIKARRLFLEKR